MCGDRTSLMSRCFDLTNHVTSSLMNFAIFPVSAEGFWQVRGRSNHSAISSRRENFLTHGIAIGLFAAFVRQKYPSTVSLTIARSSSQASPCVTMRSRIGNKEFDRTHAAKQLAASVHLFWRRVQVSFEAKRVERAETAPAAVLALISADLPRGTLSDSHFPVLVKVRCLARNKTWPT